MGAKWPISINFWNIWARNTVWEIISYLPLFVVLELGELEYPILLFHRGTWRWHLEFKKLTGTWAHEARVWPGFQRHLTHKLSNSQSHSQSFKLSQTLTLKVSEKKEKEKKKTLTLTLTYIGGRGLSSVAALSLISLTVSALNRSVRLQRLSPFTPIHSTLFLSLSLSIVKRCRLELITTFCASDSKRL